MKALFSILIIFFAHQSTFADCAGSGIWAWPQSETISENPVIYIEGYYRDQVTVRKIGEEFEIYLSSPNHVVRLEVIEILEGQMDLTQVMLKPIQPLHPDVEYELYVASIPKKSTDLPVALDLNFPKSKWKVKPLKDVTPPTFTVLPKWVSSWVVYYGCGPASGMDFEFETNEKEIFLVRTTVTNTTDNSKTTYYLNATEGKISIGQGMCSGAFRLGEGIKYKIEFSLLDGSWNKSKSIFREVVYKPENMN